MKWGGMMKWGVMIWCDMIWDLGWYGVKWIDWNERKWYDMIWHIMIWNDTPWYRIVWHDMNVVWTYIWYGSEYLLIATPFQSPRIPQNHYTCWRNNSSTLETYLLMFDDHDGINSLVIRMIYSMLQLYSPLWASHGIPISMMGWDI